MFVDLSNTTARGAPATVAATADLVPGTWSVTTRFTVMVNTRARFKVGVAWTRLYDIKVSCAPVAFFLADDEAKPGGTASLPVRCV
nr:unnamed protein product [Digitaria exilis]